MKPDRSYLLLFLLALLVRLATALPQQQPNYMDAAYSYVNALNLAAGRGFVEDFVWNYLDHPPPPPHPSHLYWMPLTSILAWLGIAVGGANYRAAQIPFVGLAAVLPLVGYWAAYRLTGRRWPAWLAGLLTLFSGFYVPYWTAIDNFTPFAVAGSLALALGGRGSEEASQRGSEEASRRISESARGRGSEGARKRIGEEANQRGGEGASRRGSESVRAAFYGLGAGACVGLAHLARADGPLLLAAIWLVYALGAWRRRAERAGSRTDGNPGMANRAHFTFHVSRFTFHVSRFTLLLVLGYLLVMAPWFIRNWQVAGTPLPSAGTQTIWLPTGSDLFTSYNALFSYGRELSARTFWAQGVGPILQGRGWALGANLQTVLATWGMIFLLPLALVGGWQCRRHPLIQAAGLYGLLLFLAMTLVFAFPGALGGLFHSGGALLPFVNAAAVVGLEGTVAWVAARRRGWDRQLAARFFGLGLLLLAVLLSGFIYYRRVLYNNAWNSADGLYPAIAAWVAETDPVATVMINNPPAYRYHGGGLSVAIPNEDVATTLRAARDYGAKYLILEASLPAPLQPAYSPTFSRPGLALVKIFNQGSGSEVYVYELSSTGE